MLSELTEAYLNGLKARESELDAALKAEEKLWEPCLETIKLKAFPVLLELLVYSSCLFAVSIIMSLREAQIFGRCRTAQIPVIGGFTIFVLINSAAINIPFIYFLITATSVSNTLNLNVSKLLLKGLFEKY